VSDYSLAQITETCDLIKSHHINSNQIKIKEHVSKSNLLYSSQITKSVII